MSEDAFTMPLVVCESQGGPYEDEAYRAGWEIGMIQARLATARMQGLIHPHVVVRRDNLPMVDLMAMHYGATLCSHELDEENYPDPEVRAKYIWAGFQWEFLWPEGVER